MNDDRPITNAQLALLMACTVTPITVLANLTALVVALLRFKDAADDSEGGAS